ncbi:MAG: TrkH family potassium uptake protein [Dysgonamonadaceae bacterium]|jgi:trk system potassium uptake protein TrkH|nr:TrkH family potassium uptake protein [Dysgonamonadaceae bacterium]
MKNFNYTFVSKIIGFLLIVETLFMLISALIGESYGETSATRSIYISAAITCASGLILLFIGLRKGKRNDISKREGYLTVTLGWILMCLFGLLPYQLSGAIPKFSNAFFEIMAGLTTTGSSTILNIEAFPKSLLFWRSLTQWIGGIGIIVFAMGFMPLFGGSTIQLFDAEVPGFMQSQSANMMRVSQLAKMFAITYVFITVLGFLLLYIGPMDTFDAACHALTSISTGGFSTKQISIAHFQSAYVEYIIILLMFIGGVNFLLIYMLFRKFSLKFLKDEEFRWYFFIIIIFTVIVSASLLISGKMTHIEYTFRTVLFQTVSMITTAGFATYDFTLWGPIYWFLFLGLILFCASEGSTSGGMKLSRLIVLVKSIFIEFKKQVHPNALFAVKMNGKLVSQNSMTNIWTFVFLYFIIVSVSCVVLSLTGMNFEESVGAAIGVLSNAGPALGEQGPAGNFANLTDFAKFYMSFLMLVGRLEIFTVLSLFFPSFWKR